MCQPLSCPMIHVRVLVLSTKYLSKSLSVISPWTTLKCAIWVQDFWISKISVTWACRIAIIAFANQGWNIPSYLVALQDKNSSLWFWNHSYNCTFEHNEVYTKAFDEGIVLESVHNDIQVWVLAHLHLHLTHMQSHKLPHTFLAISVL